MSDAESAKTQTHSAKTALFHRFSPNGSALWRPHPLKALTGRQHAGELRHPRLRHAVRGLRMAQNPLCCRCGGCRRDWKTRAGLVGLAAVPVGGGRAWLGFKPTRPATHQRHSTTGVEGVGGAGGPGCGARGRWQGLAGLRDDAPSEARSADGSRAGRRRRAHRAARSRGRDLRRPEHPWGHKQPGSTQQRARSAAAPRAPRVCQLLTG